MGKTDLQQLRTQLAKHGWATANCVSTSRDMLDLAAALGQPTPSPTGELIKVLLPTPACEAPCGTLSSIWGTDCFPLHTDTAFWPVPARFLVMAVRGDTRRPTELLSFDDALSGLGPKERGYAERSVWRTPRRPGGIYCSMRFSCRQTQGWRYDPVVMSPANQAAVHLRDAFYEILRMFPRRISILWPNTDCAVIDNWRVLHARGRAPEGERRRELFRIYVS